MTSWSKSGSQIADAGTATAVFAGDPLFHLKPEAAMDDRVAKLFAGHMGVSAVLANILIEKKVVSREEAIFPSFVSARRMTQQRRALAASTLRRRSRR
jgi:hypothetical protein